MIWVVIAFAETLHGILRVKMLNRRLGNRRARRLGVLTGSILILIIGWLSVPWIGLSSTEESLIVGGIWLAMMLGFDILFGMTVQA